MISASSIFQFIELNNKCLLERHAFRDPFFDEFRKLIRSTVILLYQADGSELAEQFKSCLFELLTSPVPFKGLREKIFSFMGMQEIVSRRFGDEIAGNYKSLIEICGELDERENQICAALKNKFSLLSDTNFKIYCHSRSVVYYQSLYGQFTRNHFLTSDCDYRNSTPFDYLIKVGPLRSRGWGNIPDAIITAPRFLILEQFVWHGSGDEHDFGYDPVSENSTTLDEKYNSIAASKKQHAGKWEISLSEYLNESKTTPIDVYSKEADDFEVLRPYQRTSNNQFVSSTIVYVDCDSDSCIPYSTYSEVITFNPLTMETDAICNRIANNGLQKDSFLIRPPSQDVDFGDIHVRNDHYSLIWKNFLKSAIDRDCDQLIVSLREAGLKLITLKDSLSRWCLPAGSVIYSPQHKEHFKILIDVLNRLSGSNVFQNQDDWCLAWREISRSRGDACQNGINEQEIVMDQLISLLQSMIDDIRSRATSESTFSIEIPTGYGFMGKVLITKIVSVEHGIFVPRDVLRNFCSIAEVDKWRE